MSIFLLYEYSSYSNIKLNFLRFQKSKEAIAQDISDVRNHCNFLIL